MSNGLLGALGGAGGSGGAGGPGFGAGPGAGAGQNDPMLDAAVSALGQLTPRSPNPTQALKQVEEALSLAHKLIMTALPQVNQWNPKVSRDLHGIGQRLVSVKMDLRKETSPDTPPMMGIPGMGALGDQPMALPPRGGALFGV